MFEHAVANPVSGRSIRATVTAVGDDLVIVVGGGQRPHVGTVVLAQPCVSQQRPDRRSVSCSILTIPPHREEAVARPIAEAVCAASGRVTVVTAGIHDDALDPAGIDDYLHLSRQMARELAARF